MRYQLTLMKNPNGTWSYVGNVPVYLAWTAKDGSRLTDKQVKDLIAANIPSMIGKTRVFNTKEDALKAAVKEKVDLNSITIVN